MAKPRVFVSSTYYDLKYVRSSLELFIGSLGYDAVLSEKGDIAYLPELALDESCCQEVLNMDIYVLIVGGRYGSEVSEQKKNFDKAQLKDFYRQYESVTKREYTTAAEQNIPIYILIEKAVYAEYQTFRRNRDSRDINYAHVDSIGVFQFIEEILAKAKNNAMQTFDRYVEIEAWLRDQWAGYFRDLLKRRSEQQQLATLSSQVAELSRVNETLKSYLEQVLMQLSPTEAANVIKRETARIAENRRKELLLDNSTVRMLMGGKNSWQTIVEVLQEARSYKELYTLMCKRLKMDEETKIFAQTMLNSPTPNLFQLGVDEVRTLINLSPYSI